MAYSPEEKEEIFKKIFKSISEGQSLRKSLKEEGMPSRKTFFKWLEEDNEKGNQYACACEEREELIFEDILNIADDNGADTRFTENGIMTDHDNIQRSKLRVDARKWALSKMNPTKYGNKLDLSVEDNTLSKEERAARLEELKSKLLK